ncbi:MAG TPA: GNAT family N-acetyltransferase [Gemmatimonadales bacterium]|nr:GNAT family N-acetyltransferase [Gemmatimonadales bacterium]
MTVTDSDRQAAEESGGESRVQDIRWANGTVRVTTPVPTRVWTAVAAADPSTMPFHTPAWRECVSSGSGWRDASRLYELPGERQLVLMMARRPGRLVQASWPEGWGAGGVLAPGGVRPDEMALVCADLAKSRSLNTTVRPGFVAAPAWPSVSGGFSSVPRAVHVAHLGQSFEDFWSRSVSARTRSNNRAAWRSLEQAGVVISRGNSPKLVREFYQVYLQWIAWRARQRKMPTALARWRARQAEPFQKFATVASRLGADCQIWVARWDGRPVGTAINLYAGESAVGWRSFTDRSVPSRFRLPEVLIVEGIRHACESGCRYIDLGQSVDNARLASIKERLGGQEHAFAEYCFGRLPLSTGQRAVERLRRRVEERVVSRSNQHDHR